MINIVEFTGDILLSITNNEFTNISNLYKLVEVNLIYNFKLVYLNEILNNDSHIIFDNTIDIYINIVKLPTNFLTVYLHGKEIIKININKLSNVFLSNRSDDLCVEKNILSNKIIENFKIKDFMNEILYHINDFDNYCILSNPELFMYSYINIDNTVNRFYGDKILEYLLHDDYDKIVDCNYNIYIIKLLLPTQYGAIKNITCHEESNTNKWINSYLIAKCSMQKYKFLGLITNYTIEINNFNETTHIFTINNNNIVKYFLKIDSLYFFLNYKQYNEYKNYFDNEISKIKYI